MLKIFSFVGILVNIAALFKFQLTQVTQFDVHNNWAMIEENVKSASELIIHFSGLSEGSLNKILSLPMPLLKVLSFGNYNPDISNPQILVNSYHAQYLTHKLLKTIVTSQYFQQLIELNLIGTNMDDKFWDFMKDIDWAGKSVKIEKLLLGNNCIGAKGFHSISLMSLPYLTQLDVSNTLLADSISVESILRILCGNKTLGCSKQLKSLDLSSTCINSPDLIKILNSINSSTLLSLNLSNLNFHQRNKYHHVYNLEVYEFVSNMSFTNLKKLQMNDLALDQQIIVMFKNWSFPNLESLSLYFNFIEDASLKLWINKANFPKLSRLILFGTDVKDESLNYLSTNFILKQLNIGNTLISKAGMSYLNQMNTSKLEKLFLKLVNIESYDLKDFLINKQLSNLKEFSLTNNKQIYNLFQYFPWDNLSNLQTLILTNTQVKNSLHLLLKSNQTLLAKLKLLMLNGTGLNAEDILEFVLKANILFPSLKVINLVPQYHLPINFTNVKAEQIIRIYEQQTSQVQGKQATKFKLGYVQFSIYDNTVFLQQIKSLSWIVLYSSKHNLFSYLKPTNQHYRDLTPTSSQKKMPPQLLFNITMEISNLLSIKNVEIIVIKSLIQWQIFQSWIHQKNIAQFLYLTSLFLQCPLQIKFLSAFLKKVKMPLLRNFRISINITHQDNDLQPLIKPIQQYANLIDLKIKMTYNGTYSRIKNYNIFFNQFKFPFLMQLDLSQSYLQVQEISGFFYNHSPTLRFINVNSNSIQRSFLPIISQFEMTMKKIDISFVSIPVNDFGNLGNANLGFLIDFKADKCDLTNQHINALVETNKNHRNFLFPKLGILSLNENDIREQGFRILFQQSLFQLISLRIKRNYNPHFLNMLLTYTTKIVEIVAVDVDMYALDRNIKPISTRRILTFAIQTFTFSELDYQILGTLNFKRLHLTQIQTKNIHSCKILQFLLNVCSNAKVIYFTFKSFKNLNSSCLDLSSQKYKNYESQIEQLGIYDRSRTTFIPQFISLLLTTKKNWKQLLLQGLSSPPYIFEKINVANMGQIQTLYLGQNYIEDEAFSNLLRSPMPRLQFLRLADTPLTLKSLALMKKFPSLQHLDLSGIALGDEGVNVLLSLNAIKLKILILQNCDIKSLKRFNEMHFPQVYYIILSGNYLTIRQVTNFLTQLNRTAWTNLWNIDVRGIPLTVSQKQSIEQLSKQKNIQIKLDAPHYLEVSNSAHY